MFAVVAMTSTAAMWESFVYHLDTLMAWRLGAPIHWLHVEKTYGAILEDDEHRQ